MYQEQFSNFVFLFGYETKMCLGISGVSGLFLQMYKASKQYIYLLACCSWNTVNFYAAIRNKD